MIPFSPGEELRLREVRSLSQDDPVRLDFGRTLDSDPFLHAICYPASFRNRGGERHPWAPSTHPVLELVGVLILLLVEVNEVMGDPLQVTVLHGPGDAEGVAGDVVDLNAVGGGQQLHAALGFGSCGD